MPKRINKHSHLQYDPQWDLHKDYMNGQDDIEHWLFNSTICEFTDISGFPVKYYVTLKELDPLFGEDPNNKYSEPFPTRFIYEPTEEATILDAFGISSDETLQYAQIPMDIFTRDSYETYETLTPSAEWEDIQLQPKVGDIITTIWNDRDYEIVFARKETNVFSSKKFIWDLILRPYRFSEESDKAAEIQYGEPTDFFDMATTDMSWKYDVPTSGADEPDTKNYGVDVYGDENTWIEKTANEETNEKDYFEDDLDNRIFGGENGE